DSKALKDDLDKAEKQARAFHKNFFTKVGALDGAKLGKAVASYEAIDELISRIMSYAQLLHAGNVTDPEIARFYQTTQERVTDISAHLVFFTLELNRIGDRALAQKMK